MIGNKLLAELFKEDDINFAMNSIGELYKQDIKKFNEELKICDLSNSTDKETEWLTVVSTYIIIMKLNINDDNNLETWLLDSRLISKIPIVIGFEKDEDSRLKLMLTGLPIMYLKNVYMSLDGFERI